MLLAIRYMPESYRPEEHKPVGPREAAPAESYDGAIVGTCTHLEHVHVTELPESVAGCEECLALGDGWVHLRICLECGKVGCCDSSPNRHASKHANQSRHPLIRSLQPDEEWSWCYVDELAMVIPEIRGRSRIRSEERRVGSSEG